MPVLPRIDESERHSPKRLRRVAKCFQAQCEILLRHLDVAARLAAAPTTSPFVPARVSPSPSGECLLRFACNCSKNDGLRLESTFRPHCKRLLALPSLVRPRFQAEPTVMDRLVQSAPNRHLTRKPRGSRSASSGLSGS